MDDKPKHEDEELKCRKDKMPGEERQNGRRQRGRDWSKLKRSERENNQDIPSLHDRHRPIIIIQDTIDTTSDLCVCRRGFSMFVSWFCCDVVSRSFPFSADRTKIAVHF